jgi:hypothetical protein
MGRKVLMLYQFDHQQRVVSLENLRAMCKRISGICHRYSIAKVSQNRVYVEYSNPNEYGTEYPVTAVFPCYPNDKDNTCVVMDILKVFCDNSLSKDGWQFFDLLMDCPHLWRNPEDSKVWRTTEEIERDIEECHAEIVRIMDER